MFENAPMAFAREFLEYQRVLQEHGVVADYNDVVADFGTVIERESWAFTVRSEKSLPYPKAVIRAALYAAFADPSGLGRGAVEAGIWMLAQYVSEAELSTEPETLAVSRRLHDLVAQVGRHEISAEQALDETGQIIVAAGPLGAPRRLHRMHRRSRAACWLDLLEHFPEVWPESSRPGVYLEWMYEHAGDVHETASEAMAQLQKVGSDSADERTRAAAHYATLYHELGDLLKESMAYPTPAEEKARHETYVAAVGWVARNMTEYVVARLAGDVDNAARSGRQFDEMLNLFKKWDDTYHQAVQLRASTPTAGSTVRAAPKLAPLTTPAKPVPTARSRSRHWIVAAVGAVLLGAAFVGANALRAQAGVSPNGDGSCFESHPIKGNLASSGEKIYHLPTGQSYRVTRAERCFNSEAEARNAGFRAAFR